MPHPNEDLLRNAYAAFGRGDFQGYISACTEDFVFHVPGANRASGHYHGGDGIMQIVAKIGEVTGGQFEELVHDVLANEAHGVVLATHRLTNGGEQKEYNTAHVYHLRGGKLAECWEQPQDPAAFEDAWR